MPAHSIHFSVFRNAIWLSIGLQHFLVSFESLGRSGEGLRHEDCGIDGNWYLYRCISHSEDYNFSGSAEDLDDCSSASSTAPRAAISKTTPAATRISRTAALASTSRTSALAAGFSKTLKTAAPAATSGTSVPTASFFPAILRATASATAPNFTKTPRTAAPGSSSTFAKTATALTLPGAVAAAATAHATRGTPTTAPGSIATASHAWVPTRTDWLRYAPVSFMAASTGRARVLFKDKAKIFAEDEYEDE